jgi:two-component system, OmpR family, alkaline phosphatase synthesis response regulator PhoP
MGKEEHPELAFLDVMPKLNGFDVCNAIKRELGLTDAYVVC